MLEISQSRSWKTASLNEFRTFFGLPPYTNFDEINPEKAPALMHFYSHPDNVEIYPGILLESAKTSGSLPPQTLSRAIFSDAIAVLRGDRFYTRVHLSLSAELRIILPRH
jgi:linoleate 8R-lipoxygenase/9,12-octadecadienoate 8-hydroperoxide 8R-isomerase